MWPPSRVQEGKCVRGESGAEAPEQRKGAGRFQELNGVRPEFTRSFLRTESVPRDILQEALPAPVAKHQSWGRKGQCDGYLRRDIPRLSPQEMASACFGLTQPGDPRPRPGLSQCRAQSVPCACWVF